jgi:MFS family permease
MGMSVTERGRGAGRIEAQGIAGRCPEHSGDRQAILAGAGIFAAGFGTINLLWWLGTWPTDLPGLWTYRSATIGDGVLLPVAAAMLVAAGARLPPAPHEPSAVAIASVLGAAVGAVVVLLWLFTPDPQLNWQQSVPHQFNVAGWYHAGFLVLASGFFAGAAMRLLWRARAQRATHLEQVEAMLHSPAAVILLVCGLGFAGLLALDCAPARTTTSILALAGTILAGSALVTGVLVWSFGRVVLRIWRRPVLGALLAVGLCLLTWPLLDPVALPLD